MEVSGPDNLPVPAQHAFGSPSTVTFTPDKPGRYHVLAAFDPVGGIHQLDLYAARNRSAEAPSFTLTRSCGAVERTRRGGWLCDMDFLRDGAVVRRLTGARVAVAGDVVWVVNGSIIERYVDTGTALEFTASAPGSSSSTTESLLATETDLVTLRVPGIYRYAYDGTTTLAQKGSAFMPTGISTIGTTGLQGILLRAGDQLALIVNTSSGTPPSGERTYQVCPYQIEPDGITRLTTSCQRLTGDVVGYEPNVLWAATPFAFTTGFSDLRRLEWTGSALVEQASLPLGQSFEMSNRGFITRSSAVPVIISPASTSNARPRATVAVYSPERRTILLELLDAEIREPVASTTLLWGPTLPTPRACASASGRRRHESAT